NIRKASPVSQETGLMQHSYPSAARGSYPQGVSCPRKDDLAIFGEPRSVAKGLQNVFALQIGVLSQDLFDRMARAELADNHAYGDAHAPNAGFSSHHAGFLGNTIKLRHVALLP